MAFGQYDEGDVRRLRFIKRAQELGFSLDDVASLVSLSAETDQLRVREITQQRVLDIRQRATQLEAMAVALEGLVTCCQKSAKGDHCPIIAALVDHAPRPAEQVAA